MIRTLIVGLMTVAVAGGCASRKTSPAATTKKAPVGFGIDSLVSNPPAVIQGKRVGLITNHTGTDSKGRSDIDVLREMKDLKLVALFAPEHGIRGSAAPGEKIVDGVDSKTGIPVYSIYGSTLESRKPTPEMLKDVDVLMFDIQDVGARAYTYPNSMALGMKAAKEKGIPFVVLDRPNPIGGELVESNLLDPKFTTFVGMFRIPMRHGMTVGELAQLYNTEFGIGADLHVVKAPGWKRSTWHDGTGRPWVPPSPNLPRFESVIHYPGTVAFEGTNLSCGRGTSHAFEQVGAPWLDSAKVIELMKAAGLPGVKYEAVQFTPVPMGDRKFDNQLCQGIRLVATDRNAYQPVRTSYVLVDAIRKAHPEQFEFRVGHFDRLAGTDRVRLSIQGGTLNEFLKEFATDEAAFRATRKPFLLYE